MVGRVGRTCTYVGLTFGLGGISGLISCSSGTVSGGVARFRNSCAHRSCHFSISGSAVKGKASLGTGCGKRIPVSGCFIPKSRIAFWMNGTCSSGPRRISIDCQRTKPLVVRAGTEGGSKSLFVGWRVCWQPMEAYIHDIEGFGTSTKSAVGISFVFSSQIHRMNKHNSQS
jgi:hypothetical protein